MGAHFAAVALKEKGHHELDWYNSELLTMSEELGRRLLPAFNTSTGLPYPKVYFKFYLGRVLGFLLCIAYMGMSEPSLFIESTDCVGDNG